MKLSVIIPIYNEAATCSLLIEKVKLIPIQKQIIVVDDCSTDGSGGILKGIGDIELIRHQVNRGKGSAVQTALTHLKGDFVVLQDGDLEYNPADYEKMLNQLENDSADVVYGSRWLGKTSSLSYHTVGNRFITWFSNRVTGAALTDMTSCYKMMPTEIFRSLDICSAGFGLEAEITAKVFKKKLRVIEVPISYERRTKSEGKKLRLTDGLIACWTLLKYTLLDFE
ncbi:MAG: glycosyltransferase family 2 protein [Candidatus Neomarinimicrobiota bacterium]|jgi:glycosyltransferase involved in cell wall biosynthesis|nr:glycosyltransferase family 2 protein [Candidatus Neomarinimicrobiota bacterium]HJN68694.1 glycosyltransferase family 2 protein [Candidatus Neomarinimicrobiota bacterium]